MEEKTLNSQQSLELITRMIDHSRAKLERGGGTLFLIWGYTSVAVSAAVVAAVYLTGNINLFWCWWGLPVVGFALQAMLLKKRDRQVKTYIDTFIGNIWRVVGIAAVALPAAGVLTPILGYQSVDGSIILPMEAIVLSIGVALTGMTLRFEPLKIGGLASMLLGFLMLFTEHYVALFILTFVVSMIIPGHKLNYRARCSKS